MKLPFEYFPENQIYLPITMKKFEDLANDPGRDQ